MAKKKRMAECHPDRPHIAHGLCQQCYACEYRERNKESVNANRRKWLEKNHEQNNERRRRRYKENNNKEREGARVGSLRTKYGITLEEYDEMLETQSNCCAICGKTPEENGKRLSVDHNHETKEVRGLLCLTCNMLLGFAQDNTDILLSAITYLRG